jgi:hypothetical protein
MSFDTEIKFKLSSIREGIEVLRQCYDEKSGRVIEGIQLGSEVSKRTGNEDCIQRFFKNKCQKDWAGVLGVDEYEEALNSSDGPKAVEVNDNQVMADGMGCELVPSIAGEFTDPASYIAGLPECMSDFEQVEVNRYATIVINGSLSAVMKLKEQQAKCKVIAEYVTAMESAGIRCRIEYIWANLQGASFGMVAKEYEENYLNTYHGNILGNFGTVRALGFALWALINDQYGLGTAMRATEDQLPTDREYAYLDFTDHSKADMRKQLERLKSVC